MVTVGGKVGATPEPNRCFQGARLGRDPPQDDGTRPNSDRVGVVGLVSDPQPEGELVGSAWIVDDPLSRADLRQLI